MRTLLIACTAALAATAVPAAPAEGQTRGDPGVTVHRNFDGAHRDRDHRRDRRRIDQAVLLDFSGRGYDDRYNDRAFAADSYNDWWHDSPSRSYPGWMQRNRNCERMWWSGGGWTC